MRYKQIGIRDILMLLGIVLLSSCSNSSSQNTQNSPSEEIDLLKSEIDMMKIDIASVRDDCSDFQEDLSRVQGEVCDNRKIEKLVFNVKQNNGFQVLDSPYGKIFVLVQDVQPHLDGHKITFSIGNPSYITLPNTKIKLRWNRPWSFDRGSTAKKWTAQREDWERAWKEGEFAIMKSFKPGSWTNVELFVAPSSVIELECVEFSIQMAHVILWPPL